ncbi:phage tail sheath subtilisin-like domain-containing protein [Flavobacterium sp. D11R37]|uniref:phage tail sheath C-terminal domain-containing protein n=1 Tax=Flavobacterium coralii TaxID=2838017 RepID=UPI001CA63B8D|nr:phage tail sheath C-terminal domain-containing protein [Flavobacterium coralii]MBY8961773.1 phage tail sheath subtilisin-like domain-containing protein [Flavobacterium coralii]
MNISSIKTPGVYINEIDAFPQSVAQVATAIPAFVGYTETAPEALKPVKIVSLLEYNQYFGGAPQPENITVVLDANNMPTTGTTVTESQYKLYNSLQLFFANGGGECYIVSVGSYEDDIDETDITAGLDALESYDEPTLLLFPDAVSLDADVLGNLQKTALLQCQELMDRFVIMDVKQDDNLDDALTSFRDNVGIQSLKYGAAYYPHLYTSFASQYNFSILNAAIPGGFKRFSPSDTELNTAIDNYISAAGSAEALKDSWESIPAADKQIDSIATTNELKANLEKVWGQLTKLGKPDTAISDAGLKTQANQVISTSLLQYARRLADFKAEYATLKTDATTTVTPVGNYGTAITGGFDAAWGANVITTLNTPNSYLDKLSTETTVGPDTFKQVDYAKITAQLTRLNNDVLAAMASAFSSFDRYLSYQQGQLVSQIPMYNVITSYLDQSLNTVPPSGAIAGIYAQTDATRGVWKAPANVSINGIVGLTDDINDREQGPMNVSDTGKSVNAIRKFTGQGFLVWGARTLDGNSNDWRYVNVRRLANTIEESIKKACQHYVFEPNTSQTWINVKGMIENYLTNVWNDGGLAGAKPSDAFFVSIGLNQTMTPQDINEGRMIVKVGYAPTRPAEFIIVEFKQMLQQS